MATDNSQFPSLYVSEEYVQKLDKSLIPNMDNLIDAQQSPGFDPNRDYSLPWLTGIDGIGWNEELTGGPVTSMTQLLTDPKLKGKVTLLGEMADTLGLVLLDNGDDPANVSDEAFDRAIKSVQDALDSGQILKFTGNDYGPPLAEGDFAACVAWSGDLAQLVLENENLKWAVPEKGGIIWTDNMFIPLGGSVPTASTLHELRLRPEDLGPDRARHELHLVGEGGQRRRRSSSIPRQARTSSSSRATRRSRSCT